MRKAAGIILIIYGAVSLFFYGPFLLTHLNLFDDDPIFSVFPTLLMISAPFIVTGGVFCLTRKYWELCFASALIAVFMMIYWIYGMTGFRFPPPDFLLFPALRWWIIWPLIITGALPLIFICLRKSEWSESQA